MSNCQIIDEGDVGADGKYFGCDIDVTDNVPQTQTCASSYRLFSGKFLHSTFLMKILSIRKYHRKKYK